MKKEYCPFGHLPEGETATFYAFIQPIDTQQTTYPYTANKTLYFTMFDISNANPMRLYFDSFSILNPKSAGSVKVTFMSETNYVIDSIQLIIGNELTYNLFVKYNKSLNKSLTDIKMLSLTNNI